jgi:hypothetical protein
MKTNKYTLALMVGLALSGLTACDDNDKPATPKPDGDALAAFVEANIEEQSQSFTLDAEAGGQIKGSQGTTIKFQANAFLTQAGTPVTGTVDIELVEIYNRSSMLLTHKPTVGRNGDDKLAMLISGGEFYVNATQGGNQLKPASGYLIIAPTNNTGGPDLDMNIFTGVEECEADLCKIVWEEEKERGIEIGEFQDAGGVTSAYWAFQSQFCWTNIDKWYSDPRPKTTIFVDVPDGFDNTNCAVFIVYDGEPTALGRFDQYDEETGMFTEHYGLIPIGLEAHIVLVSIIDDEIHYAIQSTTIVENHIEVIDEVHSITEAELIDLIDDLP